MAKKIYSRPSIAASSLFFGVYPSPIGDVFVLRSADGLLATGLGRSEADFLGDALKEYGVEAVEKQAAFGELFLLFDKYFTGKPVDFVVECKLIGSSFEMSVWNALRSIPYGQYRSYAWVAERAEGVSPKAYRAVGRACGANQLPIIIPCHRVIASSGGIGGFAEAAGGLPMKRRLLELEGVTHLRS